MLVKGEAIIFNSLAFIIMQVKFFLLYYHRAV